MAVSTAIFSLASLVTVVEPFHSAARIDKLLLAREEGMAFIANFDLELLALFGGARQKGVSAGAGD